MSTIKHCSDIHLEINGYYDFLADHHTEDDILLVAGDLIPAAALRKPKLKAIFKDTLKSWERYKQVLIIPGNHDYYHSDINIAESIIFQAIEKSGAKNVLYGSKISYEHDGIVILGCTLWTDFDKYNPVTMLQSESYMNDYAIIKNGNRLLVAEDTYRLHTDHLSWLEREVGKTKKPVLVMTHHAPLYQSSTYSNMVGAYCSDLSATLWQHPNIRAWIHGHTHTPVNYTFNDTTIVSNPRGYRGQDCYQEFSLKDSEIELN